MGASGFSSPRSRRQAWTAAAGQALAVPRATGSAAENAPAACSKAMPSALTTRRPMPSSCPASTGDSSHCRRTASVTRSGAGGTETDREAPDSHDARSQRLNSTPSTAPESSRSTCANAARSRMPASCFSRAPDASRSKPDAIAGRRGSRKNHSAAMNKAAENRLNGRSRRRMTLSIVEDSDQCRQGVVS